VNQNNLYSEYASDYIEKNDIFTRYFATNKYTHIKEARSATKIISHIKKVQSITKIISHIKEA
jgi:hypothetical protein